jgi:hypothetical protein
LGLKDEFLVGNDDEEVELEGCDVVLAVERA